MCGRFITNRSARAGKDRHCSFRQLMAADNPGALPAVSNARMRSLALGAPECLCLAARAERERERERERNSCATRTWAYATLCGNVIYNQQVTEVTLARRWLLCVGRCLVLTPWRNAA